MPASYPQAAVLFIVVLAVEGVVTPRPKYVKPIEHFFEMSLSAYAGAAASGTIIKLVTTARTAAELFHFFIASLP